MERPTYIFSLSTDLTKDLPSDLAGKLKASLNAELESDLQSLERNTIDWEKLGKAIEQGSSAELGNLVQTAYLARTEALGSAPAYQALLNRRARIALLEWKLSKGEDKRLTLELNPAHVVSAMEHQYGEWLHQVLARHLTELLPGKPKVEFLEAKHIPTYTPPPPATVPAQEGESKTYRAFRRLAAALLLVPVVGLGLVLFASYTWMADLKAEYDDLKSTVDRQKEQIISAIDRGIEQSTDVMNIIDVVKDLTLGSDSTDQD